jgi:hypothetical protein
VTVFDNNEYLGTQWLALDMLALDIGWLQEDIPSMIVMAVTVLSESGTVSHVRFGMSSKPT